MCIVDEKKRMQNIQKIFVKRGLLDICLEIDKFFDMIDLYVYPNWFSGEIVNGPVVSKYWVDLTLRYPYKKMPHPLGGRVLYDLGVKIKYKEHNQKVPVDIKTPDDFRDGSKKPKITTEKVWLVDLRVPRRFIDEVDYNELEDLDDLVDVDDIHSEKVSDNDA